MKQNITWILILAFMNAFYGFICAQENIGLEHRNSENTSSLQCSIDLIGDADKKKQEAYQLLGITANTADQDEIEYAYYKKVDKENYQLLRLENKLSSVANWADLKKFQFKDNQNRDVVIKIYGQNHRKIVYTDSFQDYKDSDGRYCHTFQDSFGNNFRVIGNFFVKDVGRDLIQDIFAHKRNIEKIRKSYELLTGKLLERIRLENKNKEIEIFGLDTQRIYDYVSKPDANFKELRRIIEDERKKNNLELEDGYIVFGENHQNLSLLLQNDRSKAKICLQKRLLKEQPRRYAENALTAAMISGTGGAICLIVRAICLKSLE